VPRGALVALTKTCAMAGSWTLPQPREARDKGQVIMSRNVLFLVIGMLVVAGGVMGYQLYQERHKTGGVEIEVGKNGLSIQQK
jgi:hypothetical protein